MPFDEISKDMPENLVPFNQTCLLENQRENLLDRYPSIRYANLNCETSVGKTIAMLSMQDTCLLVQ